VGHLPLLQAEAGSCPPPPPLLPSVGGQEASLLTKDVEGKKPWLLDYFAHAPGDFPLSVTWRRHIPPLGR